MPRVEIEKLNSYLELCNNDLSAFKCHKVENFGNAITGLPHTKP